MQDWTRFTLLTTVGPCDGCGTATAEGVENTAATKRIDALRRDVEEHCATATDLEELAGELRKESASTSDNFELLDKRVTAIESRKP